VSLIGHIGQDPEIRKFESNKQKATFSLATTELYKDAKGQKGQNTQWHNIVAWDHMAEVVAKFCNKGTEVSVEGKLVNRSYEDKEGKTRYVTEVVISDLMLLKSRKDARIGEEV